MKSAIAISLFVLIAGFNQLHAQKADREVDIFPEQVSIDHNEAVKRFSRDFVTTLSDRKNQRGALEDATGSANQVAIINLIGTGNTANITQSGIGNFALIDITGNDNDADVEQRGRSNQALLNIIGNNIGVGLSQLGNENFFSRTFTQNGFSGDFLQVGSGLNLQVSGSNGIPLIIEQRGQGAGVIIENN